jgi:hypothetical protein
MTLIQKQIDIVPTTEGDTYPYGGGTGNVYPVTTFGGGGRTDTGGISGTGGTDDITRNLATTTITFKLTGTADTNSVSIKVNGDTIALGSTSDIRTFTQAINSIELKSSDLVKYRLKGVGISGSSYVSNTIV